MFPRYLALVLLVLLATASCEHSSYVVFDSLAARSSEYAEIKFTVYNRYSSDDSIQEIVMEVPTRSDEAEFIVYDVYSGLPRTDYIPGWFVPGSMLERDEEDNYVRIVYIANSGFQLRPGEHVSFSFKAKTPDEGDYDFEFITIDSEGDEEKDDVEFIVDNQQPKVWVGGLPGSWSNKDAVLRVFCSDKGDPASGCNSSSYGFLVGREECSMNLDDYEGSVVGIKDHTWVCVVAEDFAGNSKTYGPVEVKIDKALPVVDFTQPKEDSWQDNVFDVRVVYADKKSGLAYCVYKTYDFDGSWDSTSDWIRTSCSGPKEVDSVGLDCKGTACKIEAYAIDKAGNEGDVKSRTFRMDFDEPVAELHGQEEFVSGIVEVRGIAFDSNIQRFVLQHNRPLGTVVAAGSKNVNGSLGSWDTKSINGETVLSLVVEDEPGKRTIAKKTFFVDNAPPVTVLDNEHNETHLFLDEGEEISFSVNDPGEHPTGTRKTFYRLDGDWMDYEEKFSVSENGEYVLEFYSVDELNNKEKTRRFILRVGEESILSSTARAVSKYSDNLPLLFVVLFDVFGILMIVHLLLKRRAETVR